MGHNNRRAIGNGVVFFASLLVAACGLSDRRESTARDYLTQRVIDESKGAMALDSFEKNNGYDQRAQGLQLYVLEWQGQVSAQREFWKGGDVFVGYWQDFAALPGPSGFMTARWKRFKKGATIRLTGEATLLKTERGWRVQQLAVKTAQVLNLGPKSPFDGVWSDEKISPGRTYITIREEDNGAFKFGQSALGPIPDDGPFAARLSLVDQSLVGTFDSYNFRATHGAVFRYSVKLSLGGDGKMLYSLSGLGSREDIQLSRSK